MFRTSGKFLVFILVAFVASAAASFAQSSDQNFPTPVTSNEIAGLIRARDIGDPRLTRHYYVFDGGQGDIFVNVVTQNFAGDIDVFLADGLRPLTKIVIYPEANATETGRLLYLRKGERLLLRVEGRAAGDEAATYRIKFGGAFIALAPRDTDEAPTVKDQRDPASGVRVNSVGTIVEVIPKPTPGKSETPTASVSPPADIEKEPEAVPAIPAARKAEEKEPERKRPAVVVTPAPEVATIFGRKKPVEEKPKVEPAPARTTPARSSQRTSTSRARTAAPKETKPAVEPKPDPLASIRLVVLLKSGELIEKPMSEVLRFSVDKGILVVVGKDGKTSRYSILDVARVTIE